MTDYRTRLPKNSGLCEDIFKSIDRLQCKKKTKFAVSIIEVDGRTFHPVLAEIYADSVQNHINFAQVLRVNKVFYFSNAGVFASEGIPYTYDDICYSNYLGLLSILSRSIVCHECEIWFDISIIAERLGNSASIASILSSYYSGIAGTPLEQRTFVKQGQKYTLLKTYIRNSIKGV